MIEIGMFIENRYEILEKIGTGGMSDVYKAKCHKLNRFVAIKFLKPEFCEDKNFVTNFQVEAQNAAALLHPNVVSIYDVNETNGIYYIVMEYVDGITLKKYIDINGRLPFKEATSIAIQVAQGMEAAHNAGIIHRDIKPQNVLISRDGKIKVTDFGIARTTSANTMSTDILGSAQYISPEQARGAQVDVRSDIYSFGIVFYEMVTGTLPFDGDSPVTVALKHIQESVPLVSSIVPGVPSSVDKIIEKCTQKKPERRYQKAGSLLSDLKTSLVTPNGDYVILEPEEDAGATVIMSGSDAKALRETVEGTQQRKYQSSSQQGTSSARRSSSAASSSSSRNSSQGASKNSKSSYSSNTAKKNINSRSRSDSYDGRGSGSGKSYGKKDASGRNLDRILTICGIAAGIIIVIVLIILFINLFGSGSCSGNPKQSETTTEQTTTEVPQVEVSDVVDRTLTSAQRILDTLGLTVIVEYEESDTVREGYVIKQSIKAGESVPKGSDIVLTVASAAEMVVLSDYSEMTQSEAVAALKKLGLTVVTENEYSDNVEIGFVIRTKPSAGSKLEKGSEVKLIVSRGPEDTTIEVPNVVDQDRYVAVSRIESIELKANVNYVENADKVGIVIEQSIEGGRKVEKGTTITLTVGTEPAKATVPSVIGLSEVDAYERISGSGFVPVITYEDTEKTDEVGKVLSQSIEANTSADKQTEITITVGREKATEPTTEPVTDPTTEPATDPTTSQTDTPADTTDNTDSGEGN